MMRSDQRNKQSFIKILKANKKSIFKLLIHNCQETTARHSTYSNSVKKKTINKQNQHIQQFRTHLNNYVIPREFYIPFYKFCKCDSLWVSLEWIKKKELKQIDFSIKMCLLREKDKIMWTKPFPQVSNTQPRTKTEHGYWWELAGESVHRRSH